MQLGLLWTVQDVVYHEHIERIGNTVRLKEQAWFLLRGTRKFDLADSFDEATLSAALEADDGTCVPGRSLCYYVGDRLSCAPSTLRLLGHWKILDLNGDGVWTRDEALDEDMRPRIQCRTAVDTLMLFDFMLSSLRRYPLLKEQKLVHHNISSGTAVHRAYFEWFKGEPLLCMFGSEDMCGNLLERGIFDGPLKLGTSEIIKDAKSARAYCRKLLRDDGHCDKMLSGEYHAWKMESKSQCGTREYEPFVFESRYDRGESLPMLKVDFETRQEFAKTGSVAFTIYVAILLSSFYATMYKEFKAILTAFMLCYQFPKAHDYSDSVHLPEDFATESVEGGDAGLKQCSGQPKLVALTMDHRVVVLIVTTLRLVICLLLLYTGTIFLLNDTNYISLIFDCLSLVFIMQIDELLYDSMLRIAAQRNLENFEDIVIQLPAWWPRHMGKDMWMSILICLVAVLIVREYVEKELTPMSRALECACLVEGDQCSEAVHFDRDWWYNYWTVSVPKARQEIAALMS